MDYPDAAANNPWWYCPDDNGTAAPTSEGDPSSFQFGDMIANYSTDDLFELVWGHGGDSRAGGAPAVSRLCSPRFDPPPPRSEGEMAAWLRATDQADHELPCDDGGHREQMAAGDSRPAAKGSTATRSTSSTGDSRNKKEKLPTRERMGIKEMIRKPPAGGSSSRRSHHGEAHNLTEKRRRHKINERLKALQQMVPGCDKSSNQTSTLVRTIRYMKSLQDQVQAMSVGHPAAVPAAAAYPVPVVPPQFVPPPVAMPTIPAASPVVLGHTPATVPFRTMLPLPYYHPAAVAMPAADAAPLYRYPPPGVAPPTDPVIESGNAMSADYRSSSRIKQ